MDDSNTAHLSYWNTSDNLGNETQELAMNALLQKMGVDGRAIWPRNAPFLGRRPNRLSGPIIAYGYWSNTGQVPTVPGTFRYISSFFDFERPDFVEALLPHLCRSDHPIGCREVYSLAKLEEHRIPAYLSHCVTLTLPKYRGPRQGTLIVDAPHDPKIGGEFRTQVFSQLPLLRPLGQTRLRSILTSELLRKFRLWFVRRRLMRLRRAELVVTSRLHVFYPCLAMGTPVKLVNRSEGGGTGDDPSLPNVHTAVRFSSLDLLGLRMNKVVEGFDTDEIASQFEGSLRKLLS